jgi:hypothetical protein
MPSRHNAVKITSLRRSLLVIARFEDFTKLTVGALPLSVGDNDRMG